MHLNREEILRNRSLWIERLLHPATRKGKNRLDDGNLRCFIGVGCEALNIPTSLKPNKEGKKPSNNLGVHLYLKEEYVAPKLFVELVGLKDESGSFGSRVKELKNTETLIELNDLTTKTTQELGRYLLSVIEGGDKSPFKPV